MANAQMDWTKYLLHTASEREKQMPDETSAFSLLSSLQLEHYETRTHSKIIFFLLSNGNRKCRANPFLDSFLQVLNLPQEVLDEQWDVFSEKAFDNGASRIDFVLESKTFCAIIEMKIYASDGNSQLSRYAAFGDKKKKDYIVYYLTIDGHEPEEQSFLGMDENRLRCISFENEILTWLQKCMEFVPKEGYKYSFLKQYSAAVKNICGMTDEVVNVKDLLVSSDMMRAAQIVTNSFYDRVDDITEEFFQKLSVEIKKNSGLDTYVYSDAIYVFLRRLLHQKHIYHVVLYIETVTVDHLVLDFGFVEEMKNGDFDLLPLKEAESCFPSFYTVWMNKLEALKDLPKFKRWPNVRWISLENSRGARLNFKDCSAQIDLVDEIDFQCEFISNYIVRRIINPLLDRSI